jgi:hypothetical protein
MDQSFSGFAQYSIHIYYSKATNVKSKTTKHTSHYNDS